MPTAGGKWYDVRRITLPASGEVPVNYEFRPDQISVLAETATVAGIEFIIDGAQGGGSIPLYGQGPIAFPGLSENQSIRIRNLDTAVRVIRLVAQQGYQPTQLVAPITFVRPGSVEIQSQLIYEASTMIDLNYVFLHVGRFVIIIVLMLTENWDVSEVVGVTAGGTAGINLFTRRNSPGARYSGSVTAWIVDRLGSAPMPIVLDINPLPTLDAEIYTQTFSFMDGIRAGNVDTGVCADGVANIPLAVVGDDDLSRTFAVGGTRGANAFAEGTGAPVWDGQHFINGVATRRVFMHHRGGAGAMNLQYNFAALNVSSIAGALEITTT